MKRYFKLWMLLVLIFVFTTQSQAAFKWQIGEKLTFRVRWSFVRLGTLEMHVVDSVRIKGRLLYRIKLRMDSNPVLIFVHLHNRYECLIDSLFRPVVYMVNEKNGEKRDVMIYQFDYDNNKVYWDILDSNDTTKVLEHKVLNLEHYMYDGISLTFFARGNAKLGASYRVYSFIEDRKGPVDMHFSEELHPLYFEPAKKKFSTFEVYGMFHLKGIAGVTGKYRGWFTNDDRRVPLKALMKVFVGNVVVELEKWEKWAP